MEKQTALYSIHKKNKGKMVPFAGYSMPVQFSGIIDEVKRVRSTVGLFDVSHMGEIEITGAGRKEFVDHITTNNVMNISPDGVQYTMMLYPDGGIVDDLLIYNLPDKMLLVVNASNTVKDFEWILKNKRDDIELKNNTDNVTQIAVQGPDAQKVLSNLTDFNLDSLGFYHYSFIDINSRNMLVSRTGYTGEDGFELYFNNKHAEEIWNSLMDAGSEFDIEPIGLGARDTLRMEMKYMLYGNDIDKDTTPLEAGLKWAVKLSHGDFIGRDALIEQKEKGLSRRLCCFEMLERGIPRHEYSIFTDTEEAGFVTSGNYSPSIDKYIGLGYVNVPYHKPGNNIYIDIRGSKLKALIVKPPFYKEGTVNPKK